MNPDTNSLHRRLLDELSFLKSAESLDGALARSISLGAGAGVLVPAGVSHLGEAILGECGVPRTWLTEPGSIAFVAHDRNNRMTGVVGFACSDDLSVRVDLLYWSPAAPETSSAAIEALSRWVLNCLYVERIQAGHGDPAGGWEAAGFVGGVYVPTQARNPGTNLILTAGPSVSMKEAFYAYDAAKHGWNRRWSDYLTRFEQTFAGYLGVRHAMATSSCTGALHIALAALEIGPGDEVIVPDVTWVATANAVRYVGATPVFADIEIDSWCMDARSFESKITQRTKAVIPVHLYGHPARMDKIMPIAEKHGLFVIEDAAPAVGAEWHGRKVGTYGHFAAYSFQGAKLLVTGEGGMLVTNDDALHQKAQSIWDQGRSHTRAFWIDKPGLKYKMANVQAAIGLAQIERVEELIEMKRRLFNWYAEDLGDLTCASLNHEVPGARSICWMTSLLLNERSTMTRDQLRDQLRKRNVDSRPVFPAISQYPIWPVKQAPQPVALHVGDNAINLPSGVCLRREEVAYISACVRDILAGNRL